MQAGESCPPGHPERGLTIRYLSGELEAQTAAGPRCTVYDIEPAIRALSAATTCPRDGQPGAALVDAVDAVWAGRARLMLSYAWSYCVSEIGQALGMYARTRRLEPDRTAVWICCGCVNQHRVQQERREGRCVPFEEFEQTFGSRVQAIGKVLALLSPWQRPVYTQRLWCCYELYRAVSTDEVSFELVLPPEQEQEMFEAMGHGRKHAALWQALRGVSIERAQASVEQDRVKILRLVAQNIGFDRLNQIVKSELSAWFVDSAERQLRSRLQAEGPKLAPARLCVQVGDWLTYMDQHRRAGALVADCLAALGPVTAESASVTAELHSLSVWVHYKLGQLTQAIEAASSSALSFELAGAGQSSQVALLRANTGLVRAAMGDLNGAEQEYGMALEIHAASGTGGSKEAAGVNNSLSTLHRRLGQPESAMADLDRAALIWEACGLERSVNAGWTLAARASLLVDIGKPAEALATTERLWEEIYIPLGLESPFTHFTQGRALEALGRMDDAVREYKLVVEADGRQAPGALEHAGGSEFYEQAGQRLKTIRELRVQELDRQVARTDNVNPMPDSVSHYVSS